MTKKDKYIQYNDIIEKKSILEEGEDVADISIKIGFVIMAGTKYKPQNSKR